MHAIPKRTQHYATADYSTFVAEGLESQALLSKTAEADKSIRAAVTAGSYLKNQGDGSKKQLRSSVGCTRWAESSQTHGDALALYADITGVYYRPRTAVVSWRKSGNEWSYIPHFYSDFYVFQYATSFTAAEALAARVIAGDTSATARFLTFLSAGSSKYPIDLLKEAGVDMTTDEPLDQTMRTMNRVMDEIDALLARR